MKPIEYFKGWILVLIFPLLVLSCSDTKGEPKDDEETEYEAEISPEQMACSLMTGNFYKGNEPAKGTPYDEAKPTERTEVCESYELALQDFERYIPSNKEFEPFISRGDDAITINLGKFGTVKFHRAAGEGTVARIDIDLKGMPEYSVLYRMISSLDDNYGSEIYLNELFSPGDVVFLLCPTKVRYTDSKLENGEWPDWKWRTCGAPCYGLVVETHPDRIYVFTLHSHKYKLKDYWKNTGEFYCDVISAEGWNKIYQSWRDNSQAFIRTYENFMTSETIALRKLMEGNDESPFQYVCVNGNDQDLHRSTYLARDTWYSWAYRLSKTDLRSGVIDIDRARFAFRGSWENPHCDYNYVLIEIDRTEAEKVRKDYPIN